MKILTAGQFKALDQYTIENEPVLSIDLMERASETIVSAILERWTTETPVFIFAGPGNNGGDGLAVARLLARRNFTVTAYLFNVKGYLSENCKVNKQRLSQAGNVHFIEVTEGFDFPELNENDLVIDCLFGTGLDKPLSGGFAVLAQNINASKAQIAAIDIPSGLMCEDNTYNNPTSIVKAQVTFTIQLPKLSFLFAENQKYIGQLEILDIQLHSQGIADLASCYWITEPTEIKKILKQRNPFAHKGNMGHAFLSSGRYGMAGAAFLAAKACLRTGSGKLTLHTPQLNNNMIQTALPEAILHHDPDEEIITRAEDLSKYTAAALGPGMGTHEDTAAALHDFIMQQPDKLVLDADAINIIGYHTEWIQDLPRNTILTPHPKELENLIGICSNSFERINKARDLAIKQHIYIVIKGHYTAICTPTGKIIFNPTGNAGMATAGSGDVLTGILLGLLTQSYTPAEAAQIGVYLHGLAGDLAAVKYGQESLMASDIIEAIPQAFKKIKE